MSIQELIHKMEVGGGSRFVWSAALAAIVLTLGFGYDLRAYHGFATSEAMDAAQVARNLSQGKGFSTLYLRPFSIHLVQKHNRAEHPEKILSTNVTDFARVNSPHPDLANAPVYPVVLAALIKTVSPDWKISLHKAFWSSDGSFLRYPAEFYIAILNQILLLVVVALTFLIARKLFDTPVARLAAVLTLGSDLLWKFSVSGLSTMLLLVIFLGLFLCLAKMEELARAEPAIVPRKIFYLAIAIGALLGLGLLTRYAFGWLLVPVIVFLILFGGAQRYRSSIVVAVVFALLAAPWVVRNFVVSGTFFGTAGYAITEIPGLSLMQTLSANPHFGVMVYVHKLLINLFSILQNNLFRLGECWLGMLFFAGLLLGLRNPAARRMRYFAMMCLGVFILVQALGATPLSADSPEMTSENLLALMTPLCMIFGTVFFLILLDQMKAATAVRYAVMVLLGLLVFQPLLGEILYKKSPLVYPPYYPPEIQTVSGWLHPDELMMSDVPAAVAWYGEHQCVSLTANANSEFYALNDYIKTVSGIYFTPASLDDKYFSNMARGAENGWPYFILKASTQNTFPSGFSLRVPRILGGGLFLTDRDRWNNP